MKMTTDTQCKGKRRWLLTVLVIFTALNTTEPEAVTRTLTYNWSHVYDPSYGQPAGQCTYSYPDNQPFSVPRSVVADNSVPVGTILASWSYADFNVPLSVSCTGSGIEGTYVNMQATGPVAISSASATSGAGYTIMGTLGELGSLNTSVPGIGVRFYVQSDTAGLGSSLGTPVYIRLSGFGVSTSSVAYAASGVEYPYVGPNAGQVGIVTGMVVVRNEGGVNYYSIPTRSVSLSLRADLVKTGYVTTYGPVSFSHLFNSWMNSAPANSSNAAPVPASHFLIGNGVTLIRPTCKLSSQRSTDYQVSMGRWAADTLSHLGTPAYGTDVPVRLELECNGMAENVRMRFEDAGGSHLTDGNISLYDVAGGNRIDGLEIELMHNGNQINVNGGDVVNLGNYGQGSIASSPSSDKVFAVPSTSFTGVDLQARYVQRSAITRSGSPYTGPVSGTVNLFMVYD